MAGHVHEAPYVEKVSWVDRIGQTWVFNTGHYPGAPPDHIVMDTNEGEALWFSAAGNQYVPFEDGLAPPVPQLTALPDWLKAADPPPAPGSN